MADSDGKLETATLAGGCFWCIEGVFEQLSGVERVASGYSGGPKPNPTYKEVCSGTTGHAEVVQLDFDPTVASFEDILRVFFTVHDPTTLNRQGNDTGTQYRSAVFYHSPEQKAAAEKVIRELAEQKVWRDPIVTEVTPFTEFFPAEDYHQEYFRNNPNQPYCKVVIEPKVAKFRKLFLERLKPAFK
jgi:peptide-methionine (S)-S-oxide reductase